MRDRRLPMQHVSSLHATDVVQVNARGQYILVSITGIAGTKVNIISNCFRDFRSGFVLRAYSRSLSHDCLWPKGSGGLNLEFSFPLLLLLLLLLITI